MACGNRDCCRDAAIARSRRPRLVLSRSLSPIRRLPAVQHVNGRWIQVSIKSDRSIVEQQREQVDQESIEDGYISSDVVSSITDEECDLLYATMRNMRLARAVSYNPPASTRSPPCQDPVPRRCIVRSFLQKRPAASWFRANESKQQDHERAHREESAAVPLRAH